MQQYNVAIVGATGMVGLTFIELLEERNFPVSGLRLLASERSAGQRLGFCHQDIVVDVLDRNSFAGIDFAFFSAGAGTSKEFAPIAAECGAVVIDNSSAFRMDKDTPLIVPEVNPHAIKGHNNIIANPNCSTIQLVVAIKPLHDAALIRRCVVSTYQAVSGSGKEAVAELHRQSDALLQNKEIKVQVYPHQIAFNILPHIDDFMDDGYTKEEVKVVKETRKIMEISSLAVSTTCVRVPVFNAHCISVNLEFERPLEPDEAREILLKSPGVTLSDQPQTNLYPLPVQAAGRDQVLVGRIRQDDSVKYGLNLWVVADNLRKGAALNAIQIAELMV